MINQQSRDQLSMQRRSYLAATVSTASIGLLSGCSQGTNSGQSGTPTPSDEKRAGNHIQTAGKAVQNAGEQISEQSSKLEESSLSDGGVDFEPSTINSYLDTATEELDAAEQYSTDTQQDQINALRTYVSFARKLTEFMDVFTKGYSQTATGNKYFQSERYTDTAEKLKTARSTLDEADDILTVVEDRTQQLDTEVLDTIEQIEIESLKTDLTTLDELLPVMKAFASGIRSMSLGMVDFKKADEHINNDEYTEAKNDFQKAVDDFTAAENTFKQQEGSAPSSVKSSVIELVCYSGAMKDGSRHMVTASEALANGDNQRAKDESEKAKEAFDRCSFDS